MLVYKSMYYLDYTFEYFNIIINNCYDVTKMNKNINEVLSQYDKLLNTSGIQDIKNVLGNENSLGISC